MRIRLTHYLASSVLALVMFVVSASGDCTSYGYVQQYYGGDCVGRNPGPDEVIVFQHTDYNQYERGYCAVLGRGSYAHSYSFKMPNDSVSSIKVGRNVTAYLYSDACYRGRSEGFHNIWDRRLSDNYIGNDSTSSIDVFKLLW